MQGKKAKAQQSKIGKWCIDSMLIILIIKEVHFLSEFEGRRYYMVTYLQIH